MRMGIGMGLSRHGGGGTPFDEALFSGGEDGFLISRSASAFYQENTPTTPAENTDAVGYATDISENDNHGTQGTAGYKPIQTATGHDFDGVDDRWMTTFNPTTSGSIAARFNGVAGEDMLAGSHNGAGGFCFLGINSSGQLGAGVGTQSWTVITGGADIRGAWHTGVLSWNGTTVKLYLDGSEIYSAGQSGSPNTSIPMAIGAYNSNGTPANFLDGEISHALAIDRVLTASEVSDLHDAWT